MMKFRALILSGLFLFLFFSACPSFCQDISIENLVDKYNSDTDIQKKAVVSEYLGKNITVSGVVSDASDENTFDVVNDITRHYYKITTDVANTPAGNPYRAILIYKDINKVKDIDKGQKVSFAGNIIRVVDERLYLSVWLSADVLTAEEKELFK